MSSLIGKISEETEMAVDQSSSPPRKIIKQSFGGIIQCWWHIVCGCNVRYRIDNINSLIFRISAGETIIEVPFSKDFVHFDCPCGYRVELTTNVTKPVKKTKKKRKVRVSKQEKPVMHWITEDVTPSNVPPSQPPSLHLDANPPPPSDIMPEASSSMSSLIGKKMALISISSPSTNSTPKRSYQQISEDTEMAVDQSSSPPRKIIKQSFGGIIQCWWHIVCGCNVRYRIDNINFVIFRISAGETIIEVPFSKDFVHFDCPCGYRVELTTNVSKPVKKTKRKVGRKYNSKPIRHL